MEFNSMQLHFGRLAGFYFLSKTLIYTTMNKQYTETYVHKNPHIKTCQAEKK